MEAEFGFINHGPGGCSLDGYPHLVMLDAAWHALTTTDRNGNFLGVPAKIVTLAKGQSAWFAVTFADETGYGNLKCPVADRLQLTPPGDNGSVTLSGKGAHIEPYGGTTKHLHCGEIDLTPVTAKHVLE